MENKVISARVELDSYTNKVLNIIKIKFDLKDKSQAINKFIELYGNEIIEKEVDEKYLKKIIGISNKHLEKYSEKCMNLEELNKLCEI